MYCHQYLKFFNNVQPYICPKVIWKEGLLIFWSIIRHLNFPLKAGPIKLGPFKQNEFQCRFCKLTPSICWVKSSQHISMGWHWQADIPIKFNRKHHHTSPKCKQPLIISLLLTMRSSLQNNWPHNYSKHAPVNTMNFIFSLFASWLLSFARLWFSPFILFCVQREARESNQTEENEGNKTERKGTMESILSEQSATVDELVEICIQAFGWSLKLLFLWLIIVISMWVSKNKLSESLLYILFMLY